MSARLDPGSGQRGHVEQIACGRAQPGGAGQHGVPGCHRDPRYPGLYRFGHEEGVAAGQPVEFGSV